MSNTKQPPAELIPNQLYEQMHDELYDSIKNNDTSLETAKICAQKAVDYADEQNAYIVHTFTESLEELRKQRDELVETLEHFLAFNMLSHTGDEIARELLKKIEDGKE